jgi:hypothetical protein
MNDTLITQELIDRQSKYVYEIIDRKADSVEEQRELYMNPIWRIGNMYWCISGDSGSVVKFRPKPAQCVLLYWIYVLGRRRFVILKARQLGFSTLIAIIGLDETITNKNTTFNICSHNEDSAKDLLREKVKFNLEKLPRAMQQALDIENSNQNELVFDDNWKIRSKVKVRSGTSQVLHVSEWGKVAAVDPIRSEEIRTGTLPTARASNALVFIESTFEGPASGDFYDMIQMSMKTDDSNSKNDSYWYMFFPWYYDKSYRTECEESWIENRTLEYFQRLEKELQESGNPYRFSNEQKYFWQKKGYEIGPKMQREFPSTAKEAMTAPVEGAIFAKEVLEADRRGRIFEFEWDRSRPVFAVVDIGEHDPTAIWLVQTDGRDVDLIYYYEYEPDVKKGEKGREVAAIMPPSHYVQTMQDLGFPIRRWVLPWDAQSKGSNLGWLTEYKKAGAHDVVQLKKYNGSVRAQIEYTKTAFPRYRFRRTATIDGVAAVSSWHWKTKEEGQLEPKPVHDWSSHGASALCYVGEAEKCGFLRAQPISVINARRESKRPAKFKLKRC